MTLYKQWSNLINNQTKDTFQKFWKEYCDAEIKIYKDILANYTVKPAGTVGEMIEKYQVKPVLFMGFLDGINSSLDAEMNLEEMDETSKIELTIDFDKLLTNMFKAGANHLYDLEEWHGVFTKEHYTEVYDAYRRSRTVVNEAPKIGRNDPCPCGSGKKYKKCCGKNA